MGFHKFCADNDIHCEITKVGDRYVLERMLEKGYAIGGEQSDMSFSCIIRPPVTAK